MIIFHLGAKNCVTSSCHLVQTRPDPADGINILVDCGSSYGDDPELPIDTTSITPMEAVQEIQLYLEEQGDVV